LADWLGQKRGEFGQQALEFNAQQDRDRANREFGAVDRVGGYLGLPGQLNQQALQGRGQVFDFASAAQTQQQNEIGGIMDAHEGSFNITSPETLQVLNSLIASDYGLTTNQSSARAADRGLLNK
jgi:hypothetical protein